MKANIAMAILYVALLALAVTTKGDLGFIFWGMATGLCFGYGFGAVAALQFYDARKETKDPAANK